MNKLVNNALFGLCFIILYILIFIIIPYLISPTLFNNMFKEK